MARISPTYYHRFLQTITPYYGWIQNFHPSRILQENLIIDNEIQNGSTNSLPYSILCHPIKQIHPRGIFHVQGFNDLLTNTFSSLMFELILIFTITRTIRFLLMPFKQPMIVSQIIGGIILGPSVMGRNVWFKSNVLPETTLFMVNNIGVMGFMFFLFIYGVKMDPSLLKRSRKVHVYIALIGISIPILSVFLISLLMRKNMDKDLATTSSLGVISSYLGITAFPVLYSILKELNLLNSDIGGMALSTALIGDALAAIVIILFEAGKQSETGIKNALWYMVSIVLLLLFMLIIVRPIMVWINKNTPEGQPVEQSFVVAIFIGLLVMGFLTDMFGIAVANGPLWLGLVIPDGPPLGATLVERSETIMNEFLLPFSFIMVGSHFDVFAMSATDWSLLLPLFLMVLIGYLTKFFSTWISAIYWRLPFRDGLTLSLIMSLRGQIELILFMHFMDKKMIKSPDFTLLVLMTIAITAIFTPMIPILYDPTRPYMVSQRRNIQHNPPDTELPIVLCILDDDESINGLIDILDITNPTSKSPISVYALRLYELIGRSSPVFIDHDEQEVPQIYQWKHTINLLKKYQDLKRGLLKLKFFTVVSPKQTMFQDICVLALEQVTSLIIFPFNKSCRAMNSQILNHAPCSVAILIDKGIFLEPTTTTESSSGRCGRHRFALIFLGGADSREALVYADRMISSPDVSLTVIRFLAPNGIGDNEIEKKLDDGVVTWFWIKNERNERLVYKELVVRNGEETIAGIRAMTDDFYDLWIVGRKQGINPVLLAGLSEWSNGDEELGLIGDFISSEDFSCLASVLVVQQQILRQ